MTSTSVPTIYTSGKVAETRRQLKDAVRAGGSYRIDNPMHPTTASDAAELLRMTRGECYGKTNYGTFGSRDSYNRWHLRGYVADPAYEARMAAWAARFTEPEQDAA